MGIYRTVLDSFWPNCSLISLERVMISQPLTLPCGHRVSNRLCKAAIDLESRSDWPRSVMN